MKLRKKVFIGIGVSILLIVIAVGIYLFDQAKFIEHLFQTRQAINLVQEECSPREWIKDKKDDYSWRVKKVQGKPNTYLVSYGYANVKEETSTWQGWAWEVNNAARLVRSIGKNKKLLERYNFRCIDEKKETKAAKESLDEIFKESQDVFKDLM